MVHVDFFKLSLRRFRHFCDDSETVFRCFGRLERSLRINFKTGYHRAVVICDAGRAEYFREPPLETTLSKLSSYLSHVAEVHCDGLCIEFTNIRASDSNAREGSV